MSIVDRLRCDVPADWASDFSQCLFEWQGLEGAALALLAAGASIFVLKRQIDQSDRHERQRLKRQEASVSATLPLTLSGLIESLRQMLLSLNAAAIEVRRTGAVSRFNMPSTPTEHISELKAVIASTDERTVIEPISQIIRQIQILWARVDLLTQQHEMQRRAGLGFEINGWIIQSAQVHALIESLFDYARSEAVEGPTSVGWDRAESIIFQLGIESTELGEIIKAGLTKSPSFWSLN